MSSATRLAPRLSRESTVSLLPEPLEPLMRMPMPFTSTMQPCSLTFGANSQSSRTVAELMKFIVTMEVWNTEMPAALAIATSSVGSVSPRLTTMHGICRRHISPKRLRMLSSLRCFR